MRHSVFGASDSSAGIDPPGLGQYVQHIPAEEQEIIGQGNHAEEIVGEGGSEEIQCNDCQIQQSKDPGLYGDNKEQQKMRVGIHGGITEKQTQIQIGNIGLSAKDQTPDIHHYHTSEVKKIKFKGTPCVFHGSAQRPVAKQGNGNQKKIAVACAIDKGEGDQTPDLTVENTFPVETKQIIQGVVSSHLANKINNCGTCGNVKHQVRNTHVTVLKAEAFKTASKIFQDISLLKGFCIF